MASCNIMGKPLFYLIFMSFHFFLRLSSLLVASQSPLPPPQQLWCHDDERSALWELKGSIGSKNPNDTCFGTWKLEGEAARNCCSWHGVTCGGPNSHVIGLSLDWDLDLYGSIDSNSSIFRLVHLQRLNLDLINFSNSSLPASIGNLRSLRELTISECYFQGLFPPSVSNLTQIITLALSANYFQGPMLPFITNLTRLEELDLSENEFIGEIPPSIGNLIRLTSLDLGSNQFIGEIPSQIASLYHLQELDLSFNSLHGPIPNSLSELRNLSSLSLGPNNLSGTVQLDMFSEMVNLKELILSSNSFSLATGSGDGYSLRNIQTLGLGQCNLNAFPEFLEKLGNLAELDLSCNNLSGVVPKWFLSVRLPTLFYLNLSHNSLTGFPRDLIYYNASKLEALDLRFNKLQGSLPLPSTPISDYLVSNNMLSGEISPIICDRIGGDILDLSRNTFTGELPQCLSNLDLSMLSLHGNNFHGRIPPSGSRSITCRLEMIDLSDNQFDGPLPRSLSSCSKLMFLNVGNNRINDNFPSWLGSLSSLRVLILRSNKFHGSIVVPKSNPGFPKLQIIDLSHNNFEGSLPSLYFQNWRYMGESSPERNYYLSGYMFSSWVIAGDYTKYDFSMTIANKGVEMEYGKILGYLVDLSSNSFIGKIPDSIASLHGLHLLNFSNNMLVGSVPPALGTLARLEALDLSENELSGEIPQQLTQLNFLSVFNVSYNNLSGPIPQGKQFNTFRGDSYLGNQGLCGDLISRKCGDLAPSLPPPNAKKDDGSDVSFEIEWKAVAVGYATTFVIAAVIAHKIITGHPNWFARNFGLKQLSPR